jgi:hypothetical protein
MGRRGPPASNYWSSRSTNGDRSSSAAGARRSGWRLGSDLPRTRSSRTRQWWSPTIPRGPACARSPTAGSCGTAGYWTPQLRAASVARRRCPQCDWNPTVFFGAPCAIIPSSASAAQRRTSILTGAPGQFMRSDCDVNPHVAQYQVHGKRRVRRTYHRHGASTITCAPVARIALAPASLAAV